MLPRILHRSGLIGLSGLFAVVLSACAPQPPLPAPPTAPEVPAGFPEAHYRQAEALGKQVLRVDPARSLVVVEVRRAGALARLGHDHVVAAHNLRGYVAPGERRADLFVRLDGLVVDEPELRAEAGFDTRPSPEAVAGTRRNMLEHVLEAERFPFALIHVTGNAEAPLGDASQEVRSAGAPEDAGAKAARAVSAAPAGNERPGGKKTPAADALPLAGASDGGRLRVAITLHGATRDFLVPVRVEALPDGIAVGGRLSFQQTHFGIVPLSVLGGALQVRDEVGLRFRVVATTR